jgi:uncharacterized protein (UPF0548 family)
MGSDSTADDTYGIGATPPGFRFFQRRILLSSTMVDAPDRDFERARALVRSWGPQIGAGMRVDGAENPPHIGAETVIRARVAGVIPLRAPIRVCWTVDERDRVGFAYETLPGHPENGKESFVVTRVRTADGFDEVWFTVTAYSKPAVWYSRLGGPVTRIIQNRYTNKYLRAMAIRPR